MNVRVRGIYATAITQRCVDADREVVQASQPIRDRFDDSFPVAPADVTVETTPDRLGVELSGDPLHVATLREDLAAVGVDALTWRDPAPRGACFLAPVTDALGSGAIVDLGDCEGFLPFDDADGYVDEGDVRAVQVTDPAPPWGDDRPTLTESRRRSGGIVTLDRDRTGVSADVRGDRATELARTTEIIDATPPDGWGVRWQRAAADATLDALGDALDAAVADATALDAIPHGDPDDAPMRLDAAPDHTGDAAADAASGGVADDDRGDATGDATAWCPATTWVWFGRESRFGLDDDRRTVETTMPGHHRVKAGSRSASGAVDFAEGVHEHADGDWGEDLPFAAVVDGFGPRVDDTYRLEHGKPEGRCISLGRGTITALDDRAGKLTLERQMTGGGSYDALGTRREAGDVAVTKLTEGKWWYPTRYRSETGDSKGTYVNVCTPVELFPQHARYVDLHVDVVKHPDGTVERVDDDELDAAVDAGHVTSELADRARTVATSVERALR